MKLLVIMTLLISSISAFAQYDVPFKKTSPKVVNCANGGKLQKARANTSSLSWLASGYARKCRISSWSCFPMYELDMSIPASVTAGLTSYQAKTMKEQCQEDSKQIQDFLTSSNDYCYGYDSNAWYQTNKLSKNRLYLENKSKKEEVKKKHDFYRWKNKSAASLSSSERKQLEAYTKEIELLVKSLSKSYDRDLLAVKKKYHGPALRAQCCSGSKCNPL